MSHVQVLPAEPASVYCTLYHRDPAFTALAEAELLALGGGSTPERGIWLSPGPIPWADCGYGKANGRQLAFAATLDELTEVVRALRLHAPRFSIESHSSQPRMGATAAKARVADCIDGEVSVDDPLLRLLLIVSPLGYRLLVASDAAPAGPDWLRAGHKPHNSMVALPVRIAKAMLNLTARPGDTVLDPFCGTGTIPLLAAWAGLRAVGSDISPACVGHARQNLAHFGCSATLLRADARELDQTADCIVSNPPYGVYSHLAPEAMLATLRNLARLAPRMTLVTSEKLEAPLRATGFELLQVIPVEPARFERFVYVTRAPASASP
jgi:predicted RNA methylase